jgi:hypothetical protein
LAAFGIVTTKKARAVADIAMEAHDAAVAVAANVSTFGLACCASGMAQAGPSGGITSTAAAPRLAPADHTNGRGRAITAAPLLSPASLPFGPRVTDRKQGLMADMVAHMSMGGKREAFQLLTPKSVVAFELEAGAHAAGLADDCCGGIRANTGNAGLVSDPPPPGSDDNDGVSWHGAATAAAASQAVEAKRNDGCRPGDKNGRRRQCQHDAGSSGGGESDGHAGGKGKRKRTTPREAELAAACVERLEKGRADLFLPHLGLTVGELTTFYELTKRSRKSDN